MYFTVLLEAIASSHKNKDGMLYLIRLQRDLICHRTQRVGHKCIDDRCLSVSPVFDPKSRTEVLRKLKIGGNEAHDMGNP